MKTKFFFFVFPYIATFHRKPDILIPYLYFYNIKIQTKKIHEKTTNLFFLGGARFNSAHMAGLDPAGLARSLAQASEPVGQNNQVCVKCTHTLATRKD
jgi:hypothetical protein